MQYFSIHSQHQTSSNHLAHHLPIGSYISKAILHTTEQTSNKVTATHQIINHPSIITVLPSSKVTKPLHSTRPASYIMPATPKSYLPTFAAFLAFGLTYTTIVASKEGATIDGARTRWQGQHASARRVLSGGMSEMELSEMSEK